MIWKRDIRTQCIDIKIWTVKIKPLTKTCPANAMGNVIWIGLHKCVIFDHMHEWILMRIKNLWNGTNQQSKNDVKWIIWYFKSSWFFYLNA